MKLGYLFAASLMAVPLTAGSAYDVVALSWPLPVDTLTGINNVGQLVGTNYPSGFFIATTAGPKIPIPPPPSWTSFTTSRLNDSGQTTGYGAPTGGPVQNQAFVGSAASSAAIPLPAGWLGSTGFAINKSGQVTGTGTDANRLSRAFIGTPAGISVIPLPSGFTSTDSRDINDSGQVAGTAIAGLTVSQAFIGTSTGVMLIPVLPGWSMTEGHAINNLGQVAGVGNAPGNVLQAFIGNGAGMTAIPLPSEANFVSVMAMNDLGQVIGWGGSEPSYRVTWVWDSVNGTRILGDLIPSGWTIENVWDINDLGQILANGRFDGGDPQYFVLKPSNGPLTITGPASLSTGTVGIAYGPVQFSPGQGSGGYSWSATGLPNGITLSPTGQLSGTPTAGSQGVYSPHFTVRDSANTSVTVTRTLTIMTPAPLLITSPASLSPQVVGNSFFVQFTATGGTGGYSWSATGLPSGVTMSAGGLLGGAPAQGSQGTYSPQFTVKDSSNASTGVTRSFAIYLPVTITGPTTLPAGTVGSPYGPIQFTATGGSTTYDWQAGGLPNGLTFSSTGVLSGTPAPGSAGFYTVGIAIMDPVSYGSATRPLTIVQSTQPAPVISSVSPNPFPGDRDQILTINGSGFQAGTGLRVHLTGGDFSADFTGSQVTFLSSTQLTIVLNVPAAAMNRTVEVFNPDGKSSNPFVFPVAAQPVITSLALPQLAFGGGWYTALYFSNTTSSAVSIQVNFIGENGTPLSVPLVGIGSVSSRTTTLNPGATVILEAPNAGALVQGWAEASLPPGIVGYAVFRQAVTGRADQEAVVPLTPESSQTADFAYDDTNFTTTVALVNPSNQQVPVAVVLHDLDGSLIGSGQVVLEPRSKQAIALKNLAGLSSAAGKRGWAAFMALNGAISVLGLRFGGEAFTSIPVSHRTGAASPASVVALPQIAFGGGWYTALYFSNTTNSAVNAQISFIGENGAPLTVPLLNIGALTSRTVSLNPGATVVLEAPNTNGSLTQGWAEASLPPGVVGYAVFRQSVDGRADQEAVVPLTSESSQTADLVYDDTGLTTSVAFVNPGNQQSTITVAIRSSDGSQAGSAQVVLPARSRQAVTLRDLPGLAPATGQRGWASFSVASGSISVLGLRFGAEAFTSIPAAQR